MSRASTERDAAVNLMITAVMNEAFFNSELKNMLMEAVKRMTVTELEQMVAKHTNYEDLMDLEVRM